MQSTDNYLSHHRGLKLHYVSWGEKDAPPLLLLHGWMDIARSWDNVAPRLAAHYRVHALDFRGHGLSDEAGPGGSYHFPDYVADVNALVQKEVAERKFTLIGHSMGGMVASLYAGTFPEKLEKFVNIEGFGSTMNAPEDAPNRMALWLKTTHQQLGKERRPYKSVEEAAQKLQKANANLPHAFAVHLATHRTEKGGDGFYRWRFDPLHKTRSPHPFSNEAARAFWSRVDVPSLFVVGEKSNFKQMVPDWKERVGYYPRARIAEIPGAGHMIHHEQPDALAKTLLGFLAETA